MLLEVIINRKQERGTIWVLSCLLEDEFTWMDKKMRLVRNAITDDRLLCLVLSGHSDTYRGTFGDFFLRPEVKCNINEVHPR